MTITLAPHQRHKSPVLADSHPSAGWLALESARADFTLCEHYSHGSQGDEPRVLIMGAGSLGGDILSESNSAALSDMGHAWRNDDRADVHGDDVDVEWHRNGPYVSVCVAPDTIDADLLGEIITVAEGFADYPVLDESDNSERELTAWNESMDWELRDWPESTHDALREAVDMEWFGYAEPGYVAAEWVTATARTLGLTRRRVRLDGQRPYQADRVDVLGRDRDGEWAWHPVGRIFNGAVRL